MQPFLQQLWDVYVLYKCLLYTGGVGGVRRRCTCVGEGERSENLIFRHQRVGNSSFIIFFHGRPRSSFPLIFAQLRSRKFKRDVNNRRSPVGKATEQVCSGCGWKGRVGFYLLRGVRYLKSSA